ncbi:MAG: hypothetical protein AB1498_06335 [bacterium]
MKKFFIMVFIFLFFPLFVLLAAQAPDVILYDNKVFELFSNPLEPLYAKEGNRPYFREKAYNYLSKNNWRGYVAYWEIREDTLYLRGIEAWTGGSKYAKTSDCRRVDLKELFGEKCREGRVKADWFSGELRIPDGNIIKYVNLDYDSIYERDIILVIESGKVTNKKIIDNTQSENPSQKETGK